MSQESGDGALPDRAYLRPGGLSYVYQGEEQPDFHDRTDVPAPVRRQIARWAVSAGTASDAQQRLADLPEDEPVRAGVASDELEMDELLLGSSLFAHAAAYLTDDERERLLRPQPFLGRALAWPLRPHDVELVFGISDNKLRDWEADGLISSVRLGSAHYRGYFRRHILMALLVSKFLDRGLGKTTIRTFVGLEPADRWDGLKEFREIHRMETAPRGEIAAPRPVVELDLTAWEPDRAVAGERSHS